jgi:hypothetical protein
MSAYKATFPFGTGRIEIVAATERELFERASFFVELPTDCSHCSEGKMIPNHRSPNGNDYYAMVCNNPACGYRYKISITKEGGRLYPKREWEPPYTGGNDGRDEQPRQQTGPVPTQPAQERDYPPSGGHGRPYGQR